MQWGRGGKGRGGGVHPEQRDENGENRVVWQSMYYLYIITIHGPNSAAKWAPLVQLLIINAAGWMDRRTNKREGAGGLEADRSGGRAVRR